MRAPSLQPRISNLHIAITGASSGIGAALALAYARDDVRLSLHGRSAERLAEIAAQARGQGAIVTTTTGDVTDASAMAAWIADANLAQPIDLVIANAGISAGTSGMDAGAQPVEKIFAVNWRGVLNTIHPVIPLMQRQGRGQIALMSSQASFRGFAGVGAYCASKAAVRIYGEALRADLMPQGIAVNVICPGYVQTPLTDANPFPMPFMMDTGRAARIIQNGLAKNRARIAFPWQMNWLIGLAALLPLDWVIRLTRGRPQKPPFDAA